MKSIASLDTFPLSCSILLNLSFLSNTIDMKYKMLVSMFLNGGRKGNFVKSKLCKGLFFMWHVETHIGHREMYRVLNWSKITFSLRIFCFRVFSICKPQIQALSAYSYLHTCAEWQNILVAICTLCQMRLNEATLCLLVLILSML